MGSLLPCNSDQVAAATRGTGLWDARGMLWVVNGAGARLGEELGDDEYCVAGFLGGRRETWQLRGKCPALPHILAISLATLSRKGALHKARSLLGWSRLVLVAQDTPQAPPRFGSRRTHHWASATSCCVEPGHPQGGGRRGQLPPEP